MISKFIKNCKIVENGKIVEKNILLEGDKIALVTEERITAEEIIDAKGNLVLPGVIDCHVHFREPGLTHKEDFVSGSYAAAKGGITTILDMPNTVPPTVTLEALEEKRQLAKKSIVNYGFHFGATADNIEAIKKVENIASVKVFMNETTGSLKVDENLDAIFREAKTVSVHAEDEKVQLAIDLFKKQFDKSKILYFCHVSAAEALKIIKRNKTAHMYIEVTPHHLFLAADDLVKLKGYGMMKPSLKTKEDQDALWDAISKGLVDTIATDHAPHTKEEKEQENPLSGVPGVETMLPLLLDAVNKNRITPQQLTDLISKNPAKIFKIKNKGMIAEGYDADLTIVDMNMQKEVQTDELLSKCKWSPFEGKVLKGWPVTTIVNGNIVYDHGSIFDIKGKEVKYFKRIAEKEDEQDVLKNP